MNEGDLRKFEYEKTKNIIGLELLEIVQLVCRTIQITSFYFALQKDTRIGFSFLVLIWSSIMT